MKNAPQFEVGLKPINHDDWLTPDDGEYFLPQKNILLDTKPVYFALDNSDNEQKETAEIIAQILNIDLKNHEPPLKEISRYISDDLIIMARRDNEWKVIALTLCSPTFFSAEYAIGKSLFSLHQPVPDGDYKLTPRITRVFDNLKEGAILERFNWTIQWSDERYTPDGEILRKMANDAELNQAENMLHERVERQTIRILPKTNAILFTIRVRTTKIADILQNNLAKQKLCDAWQNAAPNLRDYKKWSHINRHLEYLLQKNNH